MLIEHICKLWSPQLAPIILFFFACTKYFLSLLPKPIILLCLHVHILHPLTLPLCLFSLRALRALNIMLFVSAIPNHFILYGHANSSIYVFPVCTNQFTFLAHTNSACRSFHSFLHVHTLHPQTLIFNLHALTIMLFVFVFPNHFIFYGLTNSPLHSFPVCPNPSTCLAHPNPAWW